jgi:hypothetical protein
MTANDDEARRLLEAAERMYEAARAVDRAAGDPFGLRVSLRQEEDADDDEEASS